MNKNKKRSEKNKSRGLSKNGGSFGRTHKGNKGNNKYIENTSHQELSKRIAYKGLKRIAKNVEYLFDILNIGKTYKFKNKINELFNVFICHTSCYQDMVKDYNPGFKEYLIQTLDISNNNRINIDQVQQLYKKFTSIHHIKKTTPKEIGSKKYHFSSYLENLLFAEYITHQFGSIGSNIITINDISYKVFVSSIYDDISHGVDIRLEDSKGNYIPIDITLYNHTPPSSSKIIIHYNDYLKDFLSFIEGYTNQRYHHSNIENFRENNIIPKTILEQHIGHLINIYHSENILPSLNPNIHNRISMDLSNFDHTDDK